MENNWYKPEVFDNPRGIGYSFLANDNVRYFLLFNRIGAESAFLKRLGGNVEGFLLEFYHSDGSVGASENMANETIGNIIYNFFEERPQAVIFGVYDDTRVSEKARHRLFDIWFRRYNKNNFLKKIGVLTGQDRSQIVTLMFRTDNDRFSDIL